MEKEEKKEIVESILNLRGRQSVRATFKLSEKAIDAISIISVHLGIKQKSLIDHLFEDNESLSLIAKEAQSDEFQQPNRIQKTYVLSRKTLSCLDRTSRSFDTPRDALVECSIKRLLPVIANERKKHLMRKEVLNEIKEFLKQGEKLLKKSRALLGEDDPVYGKFECAIAVLLNAHSDIEFFVEKGKVIENFDRK